MMKRTVALTILGALLALSFSGCALTYSKTRVSGCKVVKEFGLLGGLVKLYKSEKPLEADGCAKVQGHPLPKDHPKVHGYSILEGHPKEKGHLILEGHPKVQEHSK